MSILILKIIAIISILLDNIGKIFVQEQVSIERVILMLLGSIALPMIIFILLEGYHETKDKNNFIKKLAIFAFVSEIPYDLAFQGVILEFGNQNLLFTLLLSILCIRAIDEIGEKYKGKMININILNGLVTLAFCFIAAIFGTEMGYVGVLLVVAFHLFRGNKALILVSILIVLGYLIGDVIYGLFALLSMAFIWPYKGKKGKNVEHLFSIFYPVHLLILFIIKTFL